MSDVVLRDYVPGEPWKGLLARTADGGYEVHLWAVDIADCPHHEQGRQALGLGLDDCVCAAGGHDAAPRAAVLFSVPSGEREALEAALRERLPGVEIVPEDNPWVFG